MMEYTDVDWVGSVDDRKSTSASAYYLGECLVSWARRKQSPISLSTTKAKYIATAECCTQILWMKKTLEDRKLKVINQYHFFVIIQLQ